MRRILSFTLLIIITTTSCVNEKKKKEKLIEEAGAKELYRKIENRDDIFDYFKVQIEAKVEKGDNFQLFYSEDYQLSFSQNEMITIPVKGEKEYQKIVFDIPKGVFPERYRFDVGGNPEQNKINIRSLKVTYNKNIVHIPQDSIFKYLVPNIYITPQTEEGSYLLNKIEQEGILPYDPYFTCSPELVRLLLKL